MEGRKLRRQNKHVKEPKKRKEKVKKERVEIAKNERPSTNILKLLSRILIVVLAVIVVAILGTVIYLKVLPNKYLIPMCVLVAVLVGTGIFVLFRRKASNILRIVLSSVSVILIALFGFIGTKLIKTMDFIGDMTTETVNAKTYSVVVLKGSEYAKLEDVQYKLLLYYDTELNQTQSAIDKLNGVMTIVTEKTDDVHELADKLIDGSVDAILIEDSYYVMIEEEIEDFRDKTNVIYTFALEDTIETIAKNVSVTEEPFIVYISGIDSYGKISSVARSDVNMLGVVNPKTKQVLLVNTPRDYYVKLSGTSGYRDKLTHAGIYGIDMSVKTMEKLYDIDVNYYVRVNFTSLIKIIDAIGGINVYSEYAFTSRIGKYKFVKGYNQMNGKQALGFARERYSFSDGDRMRGQNQQAVIDAVIKKVSSSATMLTKFDALLDSVEGSFQTNVEYTKMLELVRMQISDGASWNVSSISVDGSGSMERTYSMGKRLLSVLIPYAGSINKAESMIKAVLDGEMLEAGTIDISKYNDYLVVPRGVYETEEEEEPEEEKPEEQPEVTPGTGDSGNTGGNTGDAENTGDNTGDSGNTGDSTGDTGNSADNTGDTENTGDSTGDTGNSGDNTGDTGNTGDSTGDTGNSGDNTGDTGNVGDSSGDTGNSGDNTGDTGNTGDGTGDTGNSGGNTGDTGNTGDSNGDTGGSGDNNSDSAGES